MSWSVSWSLRVFWNFNHFCDKYYNCNNFFCILLDTRLSYMHFKDLIIKGKPQALKMFSITKSKTPQIRAWPWHILMSLFVCSTKYIRSNSWMTAVKREIKCISKQIHQILDYSSFIKASFCLKCNFNVNIAVSGLTEHCPIFHFPPSVLHPCSVCPPSVRPSVRLSQAWHLNFSWLFYG